MNKEFSIQQDKLQREAEVVGIHNFDVGAGVVRNSSLLLVRRVPEDFMGGYYELPGGGVELGETFEGALRREVREEIGLNTTLIIGMIKGFDYTNGTTQVRQFNFLVEVEDGDIRLEPKEHDCFVWLNRDNIDSIELTPEMREVVGSYLEPENPAGDTNASH